MLNVLNVLNMSKALLLSLKSAASTNLVDLKGSSEGLRGSWVASKVAERASETAGRAAEGGRRERTEKKENA